MATTDKIRFRWSNYMKPTPQNIMGLAAALRRLVAIATGFSIIMDANKYIPLIIVGVGWTLDELKNFAANVAEHEKETATAQFSDGQIVEITKDVPDPDKKDE